MKYSYELMHKAVNVSGGGQRYLFQEHAVSEATYYRWLKKYRDGVGSDRSHGEEKIRTIREQHQKEMDQKCEEFVEHANGVMKSNLQSFTDHVNSLLIVHCDTDLEELLSNTKAVYEPKYLGCTQ